MAAKAGDALWDLSQLDNLNNDSILLTLKSRYAQDKIYTNCGDILIAINPCKDLPIFGKTQHDEYNWDNITKVPPPHVFYVASRAYSRMRQSNTNQVILVSGGSGAGKTESTKLMVKHFVTMCPRDTGNLHDRIVKVNPLLEAFGNAQTIMNSNSSRFAKYLELSFKDDGQVLGAVVRDYMLEKSRVTAQNDNEGNFHIFYALFAGASQELLSRDLGLTRPEDYRILEGNRDLLRKKESHAKLYRESMDVLRTIGLQDPDIDIINSLLGSILHLTQVQFAEPTEANDPLVVHNQEAVRKAAELLSVPAEDLGHALISMRSKYVGEEIVRNKTIPQANDGRDALAKSLYERLFGWLVRKINEDLHPKKQRSHTAAEIGILDIAGFEKLQRNSFEQMCINFVNERLQNFTNRNVFEYEMSQFREEGIQIANTNFENNDGLLDMFNQKTTGILALLDETTKLAQGTDNMFVQRLVENYGSNPYFTKCMKNIPQFGIKHYAGQVWYSAEDFLEKNRDLLSEDINQCMKKSENEFIVDLFTVKKGPTGTISATMFNIRQSRKAPMGGPKKPMTQEGKQLMMELGKSLMKKCGQPQPSITKVHNPKDHKTVVSYFTSSMRELLDKMRRSEPYFVRCLKPNDFLEANDFDDRRVKEQLLYNGISAIAEIRKMNLPVRKDYKSFVERYRIVLPRMTFQPNREGTMTIMKKVLPPHMRLGVKMGKTKVFMKDDASIAMERIRSRKEHKAAEVVTRTIRAVAEEKKAQKFLKQLRENELKKEMTSPANDNQLRDSSSSSKSSDSTENAGSSDDDTEDSFSSQIQANRLKDSVRHFSAVKNVDEKQKQTTSDDTPPPEPTEPQKDESAFWDIFQIISREAKSEDVHKHRYLQIIKIITYGLLSVLLFVCLVAQKISLMTLVSEPKEADLNLKSARYILVLIAMCIPYGLIFLSNLWKSLFGNVPLPKLKSIIMVLIMEAAHSCGLSLLVFRVLPEIDVVRGIMVLSATCALPCILKPLCSTNKVGQDKCTSIMGKFIELIMDLLACCAQISAIPVLVLNHYYIKGELFAQDNFKIVEVAFALFLCSFSWWENYIDDRFCGQLSQTNSLHNWMLGIKFDLQESRPIIFTLGSVIKTGIAICLAYFLRDEGISFDVSSAFNTLDKQSSDDVRLNASIIILTVSAFVGYYVAYTACKLQMQRVSFSFPLLLATPVAVAIVYFDCEYKFLDTVSQEARECDAGILDEWWHLPIAAGWLLSVFWVSRHIWFPSQGRLAKVENLFLNPLYCGILLEQHLALNRRRHTRKIIKSTYDGKKTFNLTLDNASAGAGQDKDTMNKIPPMIYACGTMWHETRQEMVQILKSLFRMDKDQFVRKQALDLENGVSPEDVEYYEFEPHILFDDAFETNDNDERVPNSFVKLLMEIMNEAASSVHEKPMTIDPPFKIPSPYGGQLVYLMPGGNLMFIHLKDKNKIRHRKRWSQVMYMYYLLGYRIIKECQERVLQAIATDKFNSLVSWREFEKNITGQMGKSQIFQFLDDEVLYRAENTFILALDGDVDFTPGAVRMLLDKMQKNPRVGASCGRIHPIGKGPMVWYQKFEYAVAHWLQKATEHVLGCVLCSPGCFSLFRGSALMDDNVMRKYTILPSEASHHLMYDQGEDRWLCTLLLQQGYRVDYAAASDAFTYAPEGFDEFFNQRRRWMPSTIANILDLLQDGRNTVAINNNISWLYIFYQGCLMVSTVLGPSTVLMMIAGAIMTVFSVDIYWSYAISCAPAVVFGFMCFFVKTKYQLIMAQVLSAVYIFIMMVVFVGCIITAAQESPLHPSVLFLSALVVIFLVSAMFHPQEFSCIIYGALYFVCVPMGYLLLVVYSLCNLHVVSWGTREVPKKKTKAELEEEARLKKEKEERKKQGFLARFMPKLQFQDFAKVFSDMQVTKKKEDETANLIQQMNKNFEKLLDMQQKQMQAQQQPEQTHALESVFVDDPNAPKPLKSALKKRAVSFSTDVEDKTEKEEVKFDNKEDASKVDDQPTIDDRCWVDKDYMGKGPTLAMHDQETGFWEGFIGRYLKPIDADKQKQKETSEKLIELRNSVCGGMAIINLLWLAINFMFQLKKPAIITFPLAANADSSDVNENNIKIDALGLLFIIFFVIILIIQFIGMMVHRWGTFLHLIAITEIPNPCGSSLEDVNVEIGKNSKDMAEKTLEFCDKLLSEPIPDYPDNEAEMQEKHTTQEMVKEALKNLSETGVKDGISNRGGIGETMRHTRGGLGMSYRNTNALIGQSYTSQLRRSEGRPFGDEKFRQSVGEFLLRASRKGVADPEDARFGGKDRAYRRRYVQKSGGVQIGATLLNNISEEPLRHFGSQTPFQRDLIRRAKDRKIDHKIKGLHKREDGAANGGDMGMSVRRGHYGIEADSEEEDDIYEEIPAAGTLSRHFQKQFVHFQKNFGNRGREAPWSRNSGIELATF